MRVWICIASVIAVFVPSDLLGEETPCFKEFEETCEERFDAINSTEEPPAACGLTDCKFAPKLELVDGAWQVVTDGFGNADPNEGDYACIDDSDPSGPQTIYELVFLPGVVYDCTRDDENGSGLEPDASTTYVTCVKKRECLQSCDVLSGTVSGSVANPAGGDDLTFTYYPGRCRSSSATPVDIGPQGKFLSVRCTGECPVSPTLPGGPGAG